MSHENDRIIFLDFDGVLNSVGTKDRIAMPPYGEKYRGLDDFRVQLVSKLALEAGAKVVISSTWREFYELEELRALLKSRGFEAEVIDQTPKAYTEIGLGFHPKRSERGDDIQAWIVANGNPQRILVLDDLWTQFFPLGKQVMTSDSSGFYDSLYARALSILVGEET